MLVILQIKWSCDISFQHQSNTGRIWNLTLDRCKRRQEWHHASVVKKLLEDFQLIKESATWNERWRHNRKCINFNKHSFCYNLSSAVLRTESFNKQYLLRAATRVVYFNVSLNTRYELPQYEPNRLVCLALSGFYFHQGKNFSLSTTSRPILLRILSPVHLVPKAFFLSELSRQKLLPVASAVGCQASLLGTRFVGLGKVKRAVTGTIAC